VSGSSEDSGRHTQVRSSGPSPNLAAATPGAASGAPYALSGADLEAGRMVGEYRIEGKLGEGGMATVYSATHPVIGKKAAIKVMSPALSADAAAVERFVQEARTVNQIGHPNIVDVFAFGRIDDGRSYFVMEWLKGETLYARMIRGRLTVPECLEILLHVCDALEAAHEKGVVHRDLKPENVFLVTQRGGRWQVKLLDFGIAKLLGDGDSRLQRTRADLVMGTPQYLSPEQARAKTVDHRTDIYSLGAMAFEMLTGRLPFVADSVMDTIIAHMKEEAPRASSVAPEVPQVLDGLLARMLEKDPAERPDLSAIRHCLADVRDDLLPELRKTTLGTGVSVPPLPMQATAPPGQLVAPRSPTPPSVLGAPSASKSISDMTDHLNLAPVAGNSRRGLLATGGFVVVVAISAAFVLIRAAAPVPVAPPPVVIRPTAPVPAAAPAVASPPPVVPATITITTNVPDARILFDSKLIAAAARSARLESVSLGDHVVEVSAPGRKTWKKTFTADAGVQLEVPVDLARATPSHTRATGTGNKDYMLDPLGHTRVR
jgi:serine/threonine protein kinase